MRSYFTGPRTYEETQAILATLTPDQISAVMESLEMVKAISDYTDREYISAKLAIPDGTCKGEGAEHHFSANMWDKPINPNLRHPDPKGG